MKAEQETEPKSQIAGDREFIFLFTDIENPALLLDRLGDQRYRSVADELWRIVATTIREFGGRKVDSGHPGFVAFEGDPTKALNAAGGILRSLKAHQDPDIRAARLRIGIHSGQAVATREGFVGLEVHRAARISTAAHGDQIIVSEPTVNLVNASNGKQQSFQFRDLGRHRLKDLSQPQRLFQLIVDGVENDFPPLSTLETFPTNLPIQLTPFIGRTREVESIGELLYDTMVREITLCGSGGVGKTRLALQVAGKVVADFQDGIYFASLAETNTEDQALAAILRVLSVRESTPRPAIEPIAEVVGSSSLLLVLDNLEHLPNLGVHLGQILDACPNLKILSTSRIPLGIESEVKYFIHPFDTPEEVGDIRELASYDSVNLFVTRARAVAPTFHLNEENASAVAQICRTLDGLPLAIELAAARTKILSPKALDKRLGSKIVSLSGARDLPERQKTLLATVEWSFDLLEANERQLLTRLSVFTGGFSRDAVDYVCDPEGNLDSKRSLDALVSSSLVQKRESDAGLQRFGMLNVVHEFALEQLEHEGDSERYRHLHARYLSELVERAAPELVREQSTLWSQCIESEYSNIAAAATWLLDHSRVEETLILLAHGWEFWWLAGHWIEPSDWVERALEQAREKGLEESLPDTVIDVLNGGFLLNLWAGLNDRSQKYVDRLVQIASSTNSLNGQAKALKDLGLFEYFVNGNLDGSMSFFKESIAFAKQANDMQTLIVSQIDLATNYQECGQLDAALALFSDSASLSKETGDVYHYCWAVSDIAATTLRQGDPTTAHAQLLEVVGLAYELGFHETFANTIDGLAATLARTAPEVAIRLQSFAHALRERHRLSLQPSLFSGKTIESTKSRLSPDKFDMEWQRGREMKPTEAIELALQTTNWSV